jgi:fumarate hydratase subunit alpha
MRSLSTEQLIAPVRAALLELALRLPEDVRRALAVAREADASPRAREILGLLLQNVQAAETQCLPLCQDTGMVVIFAEVGEEVCLAGDLQAALDEAVAAAYTEGYLRPSVLADPLRRNSNTGNNTPAIVHLQRVPGDRVTLHLAAKGGGSENQSALWMLSPSQGREGIIAAVVERVRQAGGRPCPPLILGLGLGGNFETAPLLAKRALLRTLGEPSPDPDLAALETEILAQVNATGVGPMGMGGDTTALAVHALSAPCHLATLPVALNVQCHAARHGTVVI